MSAVIRVQSNSDAVVNARCDDIRRSLQAGTGSSSTRCKRTRELARD